MAGLMAEWKVVCWDVLSVENLAQSSAAQLEAQTVAWMEQMKAAYLAANSVATKAVPREKSWVVSTAGSSVD